jgi:hypothetical protein
MKHRVGLGLTLAVCAAAEAAEPTSTALEPAAADVSIPAPAPAAKSNASRPAIAPITAKSTKKPLNLSVGDVRNYMLPNELAEALGAPDADKNTVVVEGKRELLPMKSERPVPGGLIAPFWAIAHPLQSWRIFVPDVAHAPKDEPREPADKVPPPIFRWGP